MEKLYEDYIIEHIDELIRCTKNEDQWFTYLLKHKFLDASKWEQIKHQQHDSHSRIRQMYMECLKTPNYPLLITTLEDCDNDYAAAILKKLDVTSSSKEVKLETSNGGDDFSVSDKGVVEIAKILANHYELKPDWLTIIPPALDLSGKATGELIELPATTTFRTLIFKTLNLWQQEKGYQAKFNHLEKTIRDENEKAANKLVENRQKIRSA